MSEVMRGAWVLIESVVLSSEERTGNIPVDTKQTDMKKWVKGYLKDDACIGAIVEVTTITGRIERGVLVESEPCYTVNYGKFVPEILAIGAQVKKLLFEGGAT